VEHAVRVDMTAPFLSLARPAAAGPHIAAIDAGDGIELAVAETLAVVACEQYTCFGHKARRQRQILVRTEHPVVGNRHIEAESVGTAGRRDQEAAGTL